MARDGPSQGGVALSCAFGGEMVRPSSTGLATAFFRLYLLESLVSGPARPAALLAAIAAERLPFASGAFGRALQSLIEGGYLAPAAAATVCLTALGAAERTAERERWSTMLPTLVRSRLDELMRTMTSTVRAFGNARWHVRAGAAAWTEELATTTVLLRRAEEALSMDGDRRDAA